MPRRPLKAVALCVCAVSCLFADGVPKTDPTDTIAWLQFVAGQLMALRKEIASDRVERQEARVQTLEREYAQARLENDNGEEVQRTQAQEVTQIDQRLADPALPAEEREQLQTMRTAAANSDQSYRTSLARRVTELGEVLQRERTRLASLRAAVQTISTSSADSRN